MSRHIIQAPAAERNRGPIMEVLQDRLPSAGRILEVGSGSGTHTAAFARRFPHLIWQPSDPRLEARQSVLARREEESLENIADPLDLDISLGDRWPDLLEGSVAAIFCSNVFHITPWATCEGLFAGAASALEADGVIFTYGPYSDGGVHNSEGNAEFDASLRQRDPQLGIRDVEAVVAEGSKNGFSLQEMIAMPANNRILFFRRN